MRSAKFLVPKKTPDEVIKSIVVSGIPFGAGTVTLSPEYDPTPLTTPIVAPYGVYFARLDLSDTPQGGPYTLQYHSVNSWKMQSPVSEYVYSVGPPNSPTVVVEDEN